jgi:hypothetical protein
MARADREMMDSIGRTLNAFGMASVREFDTAARVVFAEAGAVQADRFRRHG